MILFLGVVFIVFYIFAFFVRKNKDYNLGIKSSLVLKKVHYVSLFLCVAAIVLYTAFGLMFYGSWTARVFIIAALFPGVLYHFVSAKVYANKVEKIYFMVLSFIPTAFLLLLLIPFLGFVIVASLWLMLFIPGEKVYQDDNIIVQVNSKGVLSAKQFEVLKRRYIFDEVISSGRSSYNDSINVRYDQNEASIYFYGLGEDGALEASDSLKVDIGKTNINN